MTTQVNFEVVEEPPGEDPLGSEAIYLTFHQPNIQNLSVTSLRDTFVGTDHTGLSGSFAQISCEQNQLLVSEIPSTISPWAGQKNKKNLLEEVSYHETF